MRIVVKAVLGASLATAVMSAFVPTALAAEGEERDLDRWVPALGFVLGIAGNGIEGYLETTDVLGPQDTDPTGANPVQPLIEGAPASADTNMIIPSFGASLELMTPAWKRIGGRPRAFGRFDVSYAFGPDYQVPSLGNPGEFEVSGNFGGITEARVLGQGARTTARSGPLLLAAGAGLAFTVYFEDRPLRFKPSVEYMRHELEVEGYLHRAVQQANAHSSLDEFREVELYASDSTIHHMLGPGFEVDMDAVRTGDFVFAPYIGFKAMLLLDDDRTVVSDSNEFDEAAVFTINPDRWTIGATVGVRVRWSPE